jgi:hypothetical protein
MDVVVGQIASDQHGRRDRAGFIDAPVARAAHTERARCAPIPIALLIPTVRGTAGRTEDDADQAKGANGLSQDGDGRGDRWRRLGRSVEDPPYMELRKSAARTAPTSWATR